MGIWVLGPTVVVFAGVRFCTVCENCGLGFSRSVNWVSEMAKLSGYTGGGGSRLRFNVGALVGILVILLPVFFPTMFKPLSHASPSAFSVMLDLILVNLIVYCF